MSWRLRLIATLLAAVTLGLTPPPALAAAAPTPASSQVRFDSFTGIYHLSRDQRGLSLLTTEETIVADFPSTGLYGIERTIPQTYQGHSVDVKVLNVSDTGGSPVPYKTRSDHAGLTITTGDPSINLYGTQTITIRYQTSGVINLRQKTDEFLLNTNGLGWAQPFGTVSAILYIPASFGASLQGQPSCYISPSGAANIGCKIALQRDQQRMSIAAEAVSINAHRALVLDVSFRPTTFTNTQSLWRTYGVWFCIFTGIVSIGSVAYFVYVRRKGQPLALRDR